MTRVGHALACPFAVILAAVIFAASAQSRLPDAVLPAGNGTSYLLLDAIRKTVIAIDWPDPSVAIPVGSLVKPFTAIAYGQAHRMRFPIYQCASVDCWLKKGHGRIGLSVAIAQSCNSYFRQLAADVSPVDVSEIVDRFGLRGPPVDCERETLIGVGSAWLLSPLEVARAYAELAARRAESGIGEVIEGMRLAASIGTAASVGSALRGVPSLAKTGTAPCSHSPRGAADGYAVVIYPGDSPRYVLLVQVHGAVGRQAAETAARLLPLLTGAR
jgi:cell division protein FtsI/penicillin-binding protein 2